MSVPAREYTKGGDGSGVGVGWRCGCESWIWSIWLEETLRGGCAGAGGVGLFKRVPESSELNRARRSRVGLVLRLWSGLVD